MIMLQVPSRSRLVAPVVAVACVVLAGLVAVASAQAGTGDLETSFGIGGMQTTDFGGTDAAYGSAVSQPDGKVVVVGRTFPGDGSLKFAIARYDVDGTLDTTFSGDGKQTADFAQFAYAVAVQPDGKIVVAGEGGGDFVLARYNADGSPDLTFSGDGVQKTDLSGYVDSANAVALQPDGKIVAAGQAGDDFGLARYDPDGSLDVSFGVGGIQRTPIFEGGYESDSAAAVALQVDGKIVAGGTTDGLPPCDFSIDTCEDPPSDFALVRYNPDGTLDSSFSGDGKQTTDFFGGDDQGFDVALQPADGKMVAVGNASGNFGLVRYNPDGTLDNWFSDDGKQTTGFYNAGGASGVAVQPDGRILVAGGGGDFALARYDVDGSLDPNFSADGKQTTDFGGSDDASTVVLEPDGTILAAGTTYRAGGEDFALARYQGGASTGWAPENSGVPWFSGLLVEGEKLSAHGGEWIGSTPMDYSYQWRRCGQFGDNCVDIPGALGTTYVLVAADVGRTIRVRETATNAYGQSSIDSSYYKAVQPGKPPVNSSPPTISGAATEGQKLTVNPGTWSPTNVTLTFQWRRCDTAGANCLDITGATAASYVLARADIGHTIRVRETATNAYGSSSVDSAPTTVVLAKPGTPPVNSIPPTISGAATEGQTLTANRGTWAGSSTTLQYSYRWRRCDTAGANCFDITGASGTAYMLVAADVGHTIRVGETATTDDGYSSSADSAATGVVKKQRQAR
jgi:uncharacterized delta-60 repeat protein